MHVYRRCARPLALHWLRFRHFLLETDTKH